MGRIDDFLKSIKNNKDVLTTNAIRKEFSSCTSIFKICKGDPMKNELPIYLGKEKESDNILLGFGTDAPLILDKEVFAYLLAGLTKAGSKLFKASFNEDLMVNLENMLEDEDNGPNIGEGIPPDNDKEMSLEELKELMEKAEQLQQKLKETQGDEISDDYLQAKKEVEDMEEIFNSLSKEEKHQIKEEISEKEAELLFNKAKALEKELSGSLEEDAPIIYDYAYFKNIHKEKGTEILREELAKIPKGERKAIIGQILEEAKKENG